MSNFFKRNKKNVLLQEKQQIEQSILQLSALPQEELFHIYNASETGFSSDYAEELQEECGLNEITHEKERPWFVKLLASFMNPFSMVLLLVAAVSFFTEVIFAKPKDSSWATVTIILALVGISGLLQFIQEAKSDHAAKNLKEMVSSSATALRDGKQVEIPMQELVPGDIILLSAGDMLPADVRFFAAKDLFIGQSSLTGESDPVEKFATVHHAPKSALDAENIGFMGTNVVSGSARALVVSIGNQTYFGTIAKDLTGRKAETSFEKGVADVSKLLMRLMLIMVPIIFLINGITKNDWLSAMLFALSVAVGITPELLPVIMTSTLAKGAIAMSKRKTIVKNLSSIQSFGAMDVLCTDKTGTLTQDAIILEKYLDIHSNEDMRVLRHAYLNSYFQTGMKNLLDVAIIERAKKENPGTIDEYNAKYQKVDEIPFDFNRRRMSVVLVDNNNKRQLITKGALEEMLKICSLAEYKGEIIPLTEDLIQEILTLSDGLNEDGMRVLAVAQKNEVNDVDTFGVADESNMVLMGFIGFLDPPKDSAKAAISALHDHGVRVVVLTGDNEKVARTVCRQVGLEAESYLLGYQVEQMSDEELSDATERINLFAKLSPSQKSRVVRLMQENDHTVGYMGDGINDAPALHQSDVGISVDSAVDIAKESANIILLEKSLMVLEEGVIEGRRTFGNIVKYIKMASSGNFGNMFSMLAASLFLPFLPMLPIQILAQNLLYDFSQITIPLDNMDSEFLEKPQKWNAGSIANFMYRIGPISSFFDILAFLILFFVFKFNSIELQASFQTGWFMFGLLSQTSIVHLVRTARIPFLESRAALPVLLSTVIIGIIGLILPYTPIGVALGMVEISKAFIPWLFGLLLAYATTIQLIKKKYIKRFGSWI